jgi:hypothetical protein
MQVTITTQELPSTVSLAQMYIASSYPCSGVYTDAINVYFVSKVSGTVNYVPKVVLIEVSNPTVGSFGVAVSDLLKAIAISQNPELAKELLQNV